MKLFVSYSRDDRAWTYEFWRKLREDTPHDAWIDQRIMPASDWWHSILGEIENCDCFLAILSPKSVASIYCQAELNFALALNKPVLPIMLKLCDFPDVLSHARIQYQDVSNSPPMDRVLLKVLQGLHSVDMALSRNEYVTKIVSRPHEPKPTFDSTETLQIAEDATAQGNYSLAEKLLKQVIKSDKGILGDLSKERLEEIVRERERGEEYNKVKALSENPLSLRTAQKAWQQFISRYGNLYDPDNLVAMLSVVPDVKPSRVINESNDNKSNVVEKSTTRQYAPRQETTISKVDNFSDIFAGFRNSNEYSVSLSLEEAYSGTVHTVTIDNQEFKVKIAKGVNQGTKYRLKNAVSSFGKRKDTDAYVVVHVEKHKIFLRDKNDLYTRLKIEEMIAQKGGQVSVTTLQSPVWLRIPAGIKSGKKFRLPGKGMPILSKEDEFGDLYVVVVHGDTLLPHTVNIETAGGVATPLIDRETDLPAKHSVAFSTAADNQTQVEVHLCYGEGTMAADNISLGKFILDNISPAPRGVPQLEVKVEIDGAFLLMVKAEDKKTGRNQTFTPIDLKKFDAI